LTVGIIMDSEQELNKRLAEWAGLEHKHFGTIVPEPKPYCPLCNPPDFTQSLDVCFKWLWTPVLFKVGSAGWLHILNKWAVQVAMEAETPALALCKAIDKLIDGEKKDE